MESPNSRPVFDKSESPLEHLVRLSRYFGSNVEFVIAGGGNTSVKADGRLHVKGSGTALATIDREDFVEMARDPLFELLEKDLGLDPDLREEHFKRAILAARTHQEKGQRPSVECVLHNLLPKRFVVHTHSTPVNMITCCADGERLAAELFGDEVLWIPYVDPGFTLAKSLRARLSEYEKRTGRACPRAVLMQNHGLIVCGDSPDEVLDNSSKVSDPIRDRLASMGGSDPFGAVRSSDPSERSRLVGLIAPFLRGLLADGEPLKVVTFDDSEVVHSLVGAAGGESIALQGPLTPDQIVYCASFPLWFEPGGSRETPSLLERLRAALDGHRSATGFPPLVVLVPNIGMFAQGDDFAQADTVRLVYTDAIKVMAGAQRFGGIRFLPKREREFIEHWEVEAYRRNVAAGKRRSGPVAGKVALVTGAAQGFGLEIAASLAEEGAHVVLGDINARGAKEQADRLAGRWGSGRAMAVPLNVTQSASIAAAIHEMVRTYGGIDLLVSNAGILRAGSVKTQPERDFDLVTSVNYKGYFSCVQAVAPVMARQHAAKPDCWGDIIQINSKSGLAGSNKNGAYAGSKFGGIGLTQSFALELVEDGIKVNAICPGNFFDGPLWSDPETGLFVQYLRTGKVPGAETIADVRRFYEAKIPMGRGCTATDVMKALYYLISQKYETGQALPVTGGQVMLG